ncbi:hypothetical protein BJ878DRAFT_545002 [Calycina marina]|uniref:Myb-like domain-containing protein n=1 Tax=Calycina marina TaxID=1763456 RepID=A0A9P8CC66_9HELO|nr:hypothetical protein BJ878DRAFT_545002 [Calycina marina]
MVVEASDDGALMKDIEHVMDLDIRKEGSSQIRDSLGESLYSGTTAVTTHSQEQLEAMSPADMIDNLSGLYDASCGVMNLLAPEKFSTPRVGDVLGDVQRGLQDLKIPGSKLSKKFKKREDTFTEFRQHYGSTEFIQLQMTWRKLFKTDSPHVGVFRPDAILYAANVATAIKDITSKSNQSVSTPVHLRSLEAKFPESFLSSFDKEYSMGKSTLLEQSFELALDIRTQAVIADLLHSNEKPAYNPDSILASTFYQSELDPGAEDLDGFFNDQPVVSVLGELVQNTKFQSETIKQRVFDIRVAFRYSAPAKESGDLVDLESLSENFPWSEFITKMMMWGRLRLIELTNNVREQGGMELITEALKEEAMTGEGNISRPADAPKSKLAIVSNELLQKLFRKPLAKPLPIVPSGVQSRTQSLNAASSAIAEPSRPVVHLPNKSSNRHEREKAEGSSSSKILDEWDDDVNDRNKENLLGYRTAEANSRRVSNLRRETLSNGDPGPSSRKRARIETTNEDEDAAFQSDDRVPNPNKRMGASFKRPVQVNSIPTGRSHVQMNSEDEEERIRQQNRINLEIALQDDTELEEEVLDEHHHESRLEDQEHDEEDNEPQPAQIRAIARATTARNKTGGRQANPSKVPWSTSDEEELKRCIEKYGTSYAVIQMHGRFDRDLADATPGQWALKDKARNMKISYLRAGMPYDHLPVHFDFVALKKQDKIGILELRPELADYLPI